MTDKTTAEGQALIIQLNSPFLNITKILSYSFNIDETEELYYYKEFRYSVDGFSFTDFIDISQLTQTIFNKNLPVFLNFRLTQVGDGELEFDTDKMTLQTDQTDNFCLGNSVSCCDANSIVQGLVFNGCGCNEMFNPYALGNTSLLYEQLCNVVSEMFGFCVGYYRVDPDQKSRDVILKEYSLYNVAQYDTVKILIPDNQLPSRDIQYNFLQLDFPAQFEVHIVRSSFEQVFGAGARPQQHDYLYFEQYMNRMYEVDAVAQPDDVIFGSAYWRVSLVPYQKRTAVGYDGTEELKVQTEDIVTSIEDVFKEEREVEYDDTRKPNQYKTIGTLSDDYVRSYVHNLLKIEPIQVHNGYTVISKYCYDLTSIPMNDLAVKYRNGKAFAKSQYGYVNGAFTFFVNLQTKPVPKTILKFACVKKVVDTIEEKDIPANAKFYTINDIDLDIKEVGYYKKDNQYYYWSGKTDIIADYPEMDKMEKLRYDSLAKYDFLKIDRRLYCISSVDIKDGKVNVELDTPLHAPLKDFVAIKQVQKRDLLVYNDNFKVVVNGKSIEVEYDGNSYTTNYAFETNVWYQFVINYNEMSSQFSIFVYQEKDNKIQRVYKNTWNNVSIKEDTEGEWTLYGNECKFTNFRVWKAPIEEDVQSSILQQYVVNDTHLTTLVDNATPQLLIQKTK